MAHIEDRWFREETDSTTGKVRRVKSDRHGKGLRYRVRYFDPEGNERSRSFPDRQKRAADAFLHEVQNDLQRGTYLDPNAGKRTFQEYAEQWLGGQTFKGTTRENVPSRLRTQAYPYLGKYQLAAITPTVVRSWIRWMTDKKVAPSYRRVCFVHVSAILAAAVDDRIISTNPCAARSVVKPQNDKRKVVPWSDARVKAVKLALPPREEIVSVLGSGCGLRQGEMFGISPHDLDREGNAIQVQRQVQYVNGGVVFCLPKGEKTRDVPLPAGVLAELDEYMSNYPPVPVTLPWEPGGELVTVELIMTDDQGLAWLRQAFNNKVWRPALKRAGISVPTREDGTHALRHFYASALLDGGESIKAVSEYLGHADAGFTLRTYTHLMPSSHERTRRVIDHRLGYVTNGPDTPDGPETAHGTDDRRNAC